MPEWPGAGGDKNRPGAEFRLPEPPPPPPDPGEVRLGTLFYPDSGYRFLVPVKRAIPWEEGIARRTLMHLPATPQLTAELEPLGLAAVLPAQTEVLGLSIDEGVARVNFNAAFLNYPPQYERLVLGSILCTLRQFPTVEKVEILVEGAPVERFPGGAPGRLPLGPQCWINLELDDEVEDFRHYSAVKLYFCYATPNNRVLYVPVYRVLPKVEDHVEATLQELLKGPRRGSGLYSDIPPGVALRRWTVEEGLATVDLSAELMNYRGGRTGAENLVNQLALTLTELDEIEEVQILVEGKTVAPGGIDLSRPVTPSKNFNYF